MINTHSVLINGNLSTETNKWKPKGPKKKLSMAIVLEMAKPVGNEPSFVCPECNIRYNMSFATFAYGRKNFSPATFHCKICTKNYNLVKA